MSRSLNKVLYLSYTGMTDPLGQSQVLAYLKELTRTGSYRFVVVSFEKAEPYNRLKDTIRALCDENGIEWHPLSYTAKPPVLSTFRDVQRMKKLAAQLAKKHRFSLVHCRSYIPALIGLYLKKKLRLPFLFDMRGFWADERLDGGIWKMGHPLYRLIYRYFKRQERRFLLQADHVVSLTQNAKDEILSWQLRPQPSVSVIPCCVDMEHFSPKKVTAEEQQRARAECGIPEGARVISYVGSLGTWYLLEEMVAFVKQYAAAVPDTYFLVLTGEPPQMVEAAAVKAGLDTELLRVRKVPRARMPLYISLSTVSLFFIKPAFSKKASSPVKQGELMAMGIPVVCNHAVGDTEEIIEKYGAGIVVRQFTPETYCQSVETLERTRFDPAQIIAGAREFYSLQRGVSLYRQVYQSIQQA